MVQEIIQWTTEKMAKMRKKYSEPVASFLGPTNLIELKAWKLSPLRLETQKENQGFVLLL
ncbi:unnamed protein product [Acanthoscelides obtectus]|uniref:Uncharacterized protein n=1 Tax=Acanthoscelides obtectus TaxID=200917 RepID=A0A9P0KWT8_ACAOB|nr:unnamed protein product [Acanthoscelides obtectus]CAK1650639.1 hypothetical protein AOBTE_LOCUS16842 [Acanthoscelides obtectus]